MRVSIAIRELKQGVPEIQAELEVKMTLRPRYAAESPAVRRAIELRGIAQIEAWLKAWKEAR